MENKEKANCVYKNEDCPICPKDIKEECAFCNMDLPVPKDNQETFKWHLDGHKPVYNEFTIEKPVVDNETKDWLCPCGNEAQEFDLCSKKCEEEYSVKEPIIQDWKEGFEKEIYKGIDFYSIENPAKRERLRKTIIAFIEKVRNQPLEEIREKIVDLSFDDPNDGYGTIVKLKDILELIDEKLK